MLLNKKLAGALLLLLPLLISSCSKQKKEEVKQMPDFNNPKVVMEETKKVLGDNVKFARRGKFKGESPVEVAAGVEISDKNNWGIKFYLLKEEKNKLVSIYETKLLEGSFTECLVNQFKFPGFDYELVYYNSQDYFLGSGGGEIFSYIIDFKKGDTFYAHLFSEPRKPVSLFLSQNINNQSIKDFFISNFRRDFHSLTIVPDDVDLDL
ncbi:MAG TPA: hypothetical protein VMT35_01795 [Ignavibacteriaceae bacterium]|nr:hypothetical protein [Ignavibacteriaceae bacterium]